MNKQKNIKMQFFQMARKILPLFETCCLRRFYERKPCTAVKSSSCKRRVWRNLERLSEKTTTLVIIFAVFIISCGQESVEFPDDNNSSGECGSWYANSSSDSDTFDFGFFKEDTFPCLVWEQAEEDGKETFIDIGNIYLNKKYGLIDENYLLIIVSARNCSFCEELIGAIADNANEIEKYAIPIGLARSDLLDDSISLSLKEASDTLVNSDGWPTGWLLTNDDETHLPPVFDQGTPYTIIVRLSDMKITQAGNTAYTENNIDKLIEALK